MTRQFIYAVSLLLFCSFCEAGIIPADKYGKVIERAMSNFWGKAKLQDGTLATPESEKERMTVPIAMENAAQVIQAGEISSVADWCHVDWEKNYLSVTNSARSSGLTDKQVAFVGLLHGVSMGVVDSALKGKQCTAEIRENTENELRIISNRTIDFAPSAPDAHKALDGH